MSDSPSAFEPDSLTVPETEHNTSEAGVTSSKNRPYRLIRI